MKKEQESLVSGVLMVFQGSSYFLEPPYDDSDYWS